MSELSDYLAGRPVAPEAIPRLIGELEEHKTVLLARLVVPAAGEPPEHRTVQYLTVKQAAELLAVPVSYVYDLARAHRLPKVKVGKYLRFPRAELLAWAQQRAAPAGRSAEPVDTSLSTVYSPLRERKGSQKGAAPSRAHTRATRRAARRPLEHAGAVGTRRGADSPRHGSTDRAAV